MRRMTVRKVVLVALCALGAGLFACSSGPKDRTVTMAGFLFKPETITVDAGTTVTWKNTDNIAHTVTSGTPEARTGLFDSGDRVKGRSFSFTFSTAGTFTYFCNNHDGMRGTVKVT